ncbi:hypothetical protein OS493_037148 [Desmophyllum pertusum]|uniref:ZU5 domain-containing protein n=1 Tax=Desmophyllum pertusum TaxID=174260 RepID=A0A9W9ZJY2_9CNID|nr:hypothetical protein OS493_037148 [Desmophyllum pertusum]
MLFLRFFPNRDIVKREGSWWILKETGVCITFSPKAVPDPRLVKAFLWPPGTVSPPLEENETLVSNVIELACDDLVGITFSEVTVALSHSATNLAGYELVMKELTNAEGNVWKDLETWCPSDPLFENSESQGELRFAQAKITSFSMYAVICRLKSYTFSSPISKNSPEYTCTVQEYPDVGVTIPTRSLPSTEDFTLTMKRQMPPGDAWSSVYGMNVPSSGPRGSLLGVVSEG